MDHSTTPFRRACAVGATVTIVGLAAGLGGLGVSAASAAEPTSATSQSSDTSSPASGDASTPTSAPADSGTSTADTSTTAPGTTAPSTSAGSTATTPDAGTDPSGTGTTPAATTPTSATPTDTTPTATAPADATPADTTPATNAPSSSTPTTVTPAAADPEESFFAGNAVVDGNARVGDTLTASLEGSTDVGTTTYQWFRDGNAVLGATTATYALTAADLATRITVQITATSTDGTQQTTRTGAAQRFVQPAGAPGFAETSVEVHVTAGEELSYLSTATGDPGIDYSIDTTQNPLVDGVTFTNGLFSGTPFFAESGVYTVTATNAAGSASQSVSLVVDPAATAGLFGYLLPTDENSDDVWFADSLDGSSDPVTVTDGTALAVNAFFEDEFGNESASAFELGTLTSSNAADTITAESEDVPAGVVFHGSGARTLTYRAGAYTISWSVTVTGAAVTTPVATTPVVAPVGSTIVVPAAAPTRAVATAHRSGLAHTGSDDAGLLAWALGLIAAGAAVTVLRFRRRRTQR
ncbi:hypothetical protein [Curtobacterium sp. Leaf261]|uniref:hypothetical protein n=1 Tax=Curtobacterium sp. Leaf261 TaxID=1736311 RepID=UPI000A8E78E2|nr:hypothetical protein [Curtobacterium sp. Leaf261]